jgi:hypothetical protein
MIDNFTYLSASLEGLNIDSTTVTGQINNSYWLSGATATITGVTACEFGATQTGASSAIPPWAFYANTCGFSYTASTWTPAMSTTGTVGTPAYSSQVGSYEKIGRQVTVRFAIQLSGWTGSPTGNVTITGLPVAAANAGGDYGACHVYHYSVTGLAASNVGINGFVAPNTSTISLEQASNTATTAITFAQFGTTGLVQGMCNYHT